MKTIITQTLDKMQDTYFVGEKESEKIVKAVKTVVKSSKADEDGVRNLTPSLSVLTSDNYVVIKHNNRFWVFTTKGSRAYKYHGTTPPTLPEFVKNIDVDNLTSTNKLDLSMFYEDLRNDTEQWAKYLLTTITALI